MLGEINSGGKLCVKINGLWHGVGQLVQLLTVNFTKVKAIKLGTTGLSSPERYLLASNKQDKSVDVRRTSHLVGGVCDEQMINTICLRSKSYGCVAVVGK